MNIHAPTSHGHNPRISTSSQHIWQAVQSEDGTTVALPLTFAPHSLVAHIVFWALVWCCNPDICDISFTAPPQTWPMLLPVGSIAISHTTDLPWLLLVWLTLFASSSSQVSCMMSASLLLILAKAPILKHPSNQSLCSNLKKKGNMGRPQNNH
jgi:hypothetical protein